MCVRVSSFRGVCPPILTRALPPSRPRCRVRPLTLSPPPPPIQYCYTPQARARALATSTALHNFSAVAVSCARTPAYSLTAREGSPPRFPTPLSPSSVLGALLRRRVRPAAHPHGAPAPPQPPGDGGGAPRVGARRGGGVSEDKGEGEMVAAGACLRPLGLLGGTDRVVWVTNVRRPTTVHRVRWPRSGIAGTMLRVRGALSLRRVARAQQQQLVRQSPRREQTSCTRRFKRGRAASAQPAAQRAPREHT